MGAVLRRLALGFATLGCVAAAAAGRVRGAVATGVPPYGHIVVIVEENKDFAQIMDAFGIKEHLRRADDTADGVVPMTPLFATGGR